jgi:hypothetical protein
MVERVERSAWWPEVVERPCPLCGAVPPYGEGAYLSPGEAWVQALTGLCGACQEALVPGRQPHA